MFKNIIDTCIVTVAQVCKSCIYILPEDCDNTPPGLRVVRRGMSSNVTSRFKSEPFLPGVLLQPTHGVCTVSFLQLASIQPMATAIRAFVVRVCRQWLRLLLPRQVVGMT